MRALILFIVGMSLMTDVAAAQPPSNAFVAGRVVFCKSLELPVGDAGGGDQEGSAPDPGDVTPGLRRFVQPAARVLPAVNLEIKIAGTQLSARTDPDGNFALGGVPAAQPLTLQLSAATGGVLEIPNVVVGEGQTLDLGVLSLSGCDGTGGAASSPDEAAPLE